MEEVGDEGFAAAPIGSGPFKFVSWEKDQKVVLEKNPDYYGEVPQIDQLVFRVIPEAADRVAALQAGEVDIICNIPVSYTHLSVSSDHIWPILFFVSLAGNLILLFYRPLLRLLRRGEEVSEDEIMAMVEEGEESGAIERNEKELIENVFEFNNTTAEDVMIHRTDMVTLSLDDDEETILSAIRESGLSRFPVYQGNVDDIVGILSTRQYLLNFHVERPQAVSYTHLDVYKRQVRLYADEGISGTKIKNRKEFLRMMSDAEHGLFDMVVVKDISRFARNTVDLLQNVRKLKALGIETQFLTANMTSMGNSEFVLTIFGALAQEESANTSKRVKFGKKMNAEKGRVPNIVYGLSLIHI